MGYNITSKSQIIDKAKIDQGVYQMQDAGEGYNAIAKELEAIAGECNANVLSVDKETMDDDILEVSQALASYSGLVNGFGNSIHTEASVVYANQWQAYQNYLESLEKDN